MEDNVLRSHDVYTCTCTICTQWRTDNPDKVAQKE
jgi:hypothetical protein